MKKIALLPGGFKPPHAGHYNMAKWLSTNTGADKTIIFIGPKERDGITQEMSLELWKLYIQNDPKLEIRKAGVSPVRDVYDFIEQEAPIGSTVFLGMGEKDISDKRFANIPKFAEPRGITFKTELVPPQAGGVSGTEMRGFIRNDQETLFYNSLPDHVSEKDKQDAWSIVTKSQENPLNENLNEGIRDFIKTNKDKLQNLLKNFKEAWNDQKGSFKGYKGLVQKFLNDRNSLDIEEKAKLKQNTKDLFKTAGIIITFPVLGVTGNVLLAFLVDKISKGQFSNLPSQMANVVGEDLYESGANTAWEDEEGNKVTLQDILDMTKNIPIKNFPTEKLAKIVLNWDNNPEEIERISQVTVSQQYPILIMVDESGKIQWILDGNHRAQKALRSKAKTIPAKLIKPSNLSPKAKKIFSLDEDLYENSVHNMSTKDFNQIGDILRDSNKSKQIHNLLLQMFPKQKDVLNYNYTNDSYAEFKRFIHGINKYQIIGPEITQPKNIKLEPEVETEREKKFQQYINGEIDKYFRDNNTDPRKVDISKFPPITIDEEGFVMDGNHRAFLAKKQNKPLKSYKIVASQNDHPNVEKILNIINPMNEDLYDPNDHVSDYMKSSEYKAGMPDGPKKDITPSYKYKRGGLYGKMYEEDINNTQDLEEVGDGSSKPYPFHQGSDRSRDEDIYGFTTTSGEVYEVLFDYAETEGTWYLAFDTLDGKGNKVVNKGEIYSVMSTISNITFDFIKRTNPKTILFSPAKNFNNDNRRANLFLAYIREKAPNWVVGKKSGFASLTNPKYTPNKVNELDDRMYNETVTDTDIICDNCGWTWAIVDGGDDLYICHTCGHDNTPNKMSESTFSKEWWKGHINEILNETKANTHLTHLEELILTQGQDGYNQAKSFLYELIKNLKGEDNTIKNVSVKWDGAPAIFTGINPDNGKFFVGTKSVFNKSPKINYTSQDIDVNHGHAPGLAKKLKLALQYLPPVGIQGILQGDFMFDNDEFESNDIDGTPHYTFKPNTIRYAVEANSELGKRVLSSKIGIIFHTTYKDLSGGGASFGADISGLNPSNDVWFDDAYFKDATGVLLSNEEEQEILSKINEADSINVKYNELPMEISSNAKINLLNTYLNSEVRKGEFISDPFQSFEMFKEWYKVKFIEKAVSKYSPQNQEAKRKQFEDKLRTIESKKDIVINLFKVSKLLSEAKNIFIAKYDKAVATKHFIDNGDGTLSVTKAEGFVAVDHTESGIKLVDRLEFSKNNFNAGKPGAKN